MTRRSLLLVPLVLLAACADAVAPDVRTPESAAPRLSWGSGYDIHAQSFIPANETCGHYATYDGSSAGPFDWTVNGVLVAEDAYGINYTNDGSAYTVAIGDQSGGGFTSYYSETFYPQYFGDPSPACLQIME